MASITTEVANAAVIGEMVRGATSASAALLQETVARYQASVAVLRRRRDAGTLLQGTCRPDELRWALEFTAVNLPENAERKRAAALRPDPSVAQLMGYSAFLNNCSALALLLRGAAADESALSLLCDLYDESVALMVQPRILPTTRMGGELNVVKSVAQITVALNSVAAHRAWFDRLVSAFAKLQASGMIEERGMIGNEATTQMQAAIIQRGERALEGRAAAAASGQLRRCALAGCGNKEANVSHFSRCSACKTVVYCSKEHQVADWPAHKKACKATRKAVATEAA